jgi:hypothetical protein
MKQFDEIGVSLRKHLDKIINLVLDEMIWLMHNYGCYHLDINELS